MISEAIINTETIYTLREMLLGMFFVRKRENRIIGFIG
jgi:hypothetical protein